MIVLSGLMSWVRSAELAPMSDRFICAALMVALGLLGDPASGNASEAATSAANQPVAAAATAAGTETKPLWLPKTRSDWDSIANEIGLTATVAATATNSELEEVIVTAHEDLLPMDDVYDRMWGGILAPVWAILHPAEAWRVFLPIPPE
jgi:hypothetical protein